MPLLEIDNIRKSFDVNKKSIHVLKGISLSFEAGEFVSLLGESGGGKSTLMNIIGGLDSNYQGDVKLNGHSIKDASSKQLDAYRRKTIGFIFQNFNLIGHMSILDNVLVPLEMSYLSHQQQVERAKSLLNRVGLGDHIHKFPNQLSGGQKQRVSIARALASDPDIIVADEPTGALDAQNTDEVLELMDEIAKEGKLVITVTHSDKVAAYGTRIIHMQDGQIDYDKHLRDRYQSTAEDAIKLHPLRLAAIFMMSLKQLIHNWRRNLLIIFGSAIGIFSVMFMLGLGNGVKGYINNQIGSQVNPNAVQITKNQNKAFNQADVNRLGNIKDVKSAQRVAITTGAQIKRGKQSVSAQGAETYNASVNTSSITAGHQPNRNEVLVSKVLAQKFNKTNPNALVGKTIKLSFITTVKHKPVTITQKLKVSGITKASMPYVYPNYDSLKAAYAKHKAKLSTSMMVLNVKGSVENAQKVQNEVQKIKTAHGKKQYGITGLGSTIKSLNTYVNLAVNVLSGVTAISLLVSAIMIIVVLFISVSERTKEIGTLRAIGGTKVNVRNLFFSDAILLAIFSSVVATLISYGLGMTVNSLLHASIGYSIIQIQFSGVITIVIIEIIINLLAAILPASKAARLDPIQSLNYE